MNPAPSRQPPLDMFRIPIEPGATVLVRNHSIAWGWITAKGIVRHAEGDKLFITMIDFAQHTPEDANKRPKELTPSAGSVVVVSGETNPAFG